MVNFDWKFYLHLYPDLRVNGIINEVDARIHYFKYGINECRAPNSQYMKENVEKSRNKIVEEERKIRGDPLNPPLFLRGEITSFKGGFNGSPLINILIRTSSRPQYFDKCLKSILNQEYKNYRVIVCYDTEESKSYIEKYSGKCNIFYYYVEKELREKTEKYRFNLYCNSLMDKVDKGYIIFLDDDDTLTHKYVLNIISDNILFDEDFLIWKFLRPDKVIYPSDINNVKLGEIGTISACFHSKYKNMARWWDKPGGDFNFYNQLLTNKDIKFKKKFIDSILTQTNLDEIQIGNFGN